MSLESFNDDMAVNQFSFHTENGAMAEAPKRQIEVRLQELGRRKITIISGLGDEKKCKKISTEIKKKLGTGGTIKDDPEWGFIVTIQGDKRIEVREMLSFLLNINPLSIDVHGY